MFCSECGAEAKEQDRFCAECGAELEWQSDSEPGPRSDDEDTLGGGDASAEEAQAPSPDPCALVTEVKRGKGGFNWARLPVVLVGVMLAATVCALLYRAYGPGAGSLTTRGGSEQASGLPPGQPSSPIEEIDPVPDPVQETKSPAGTRPPPAPESTAPPSPEPEPEPEPAPLPPRPVPPVAEPSPPEPDPDRLFDRWKITDQKWVSGQQFPAQQVTAAWDEGYVISELAYGAGSWVAVMSRGLPYRLQSYFGGGLEFPREKISQAWNDGYQITSFAYGNGGWVVVMSKATGLGAQTWMTRTHFPRDEIAEKWDAGYHITSLAYGNGAWAVAMSKNSGLNAQRWITKSDTRVVIQEASEIYREAGFRFHFMNFGANAWGAVFSQGLPYGEQRYGVTRDFPSSEIKQGWDDGLRIVELSYGGQAWALIMARF